MEKNEIQAKLYLFAFKSNEENGVFSHLKLGSSVEQVIDVINTELTYLLGNSNKNEFSQLELEDIISYLKNCSLWCLGSIDYVSGELVPHLEEHGNLIDVLEVLKNEN